MRPYGGRPAAAGAPLHAALEVGFGQLAARLALTGVLLQTLQVLLLDLRRDWCSCNWRCGTCPTAAVEDQRRALAAAAASPTSLAALRSPTCTPQSGPAGTPPSRAAEAGSRARRQTSRLPTCRRCCAAAAAACRRWGLLPAGRQRRCLRGLGVLPRQLGARRAAGRPAAAGFAFRWGGGRAGGGGAAAIGSRICLKLSVLAGCPAGRAYTRRCMKEGMRRLPCEVRAEQP